jgi:hypothetical protein
MDILENGKCLYYFAYATLQYVQSSLAPYQRIRYFRYKKTLNVKICNKKKIQVKPKILSVTRRCRPVVGRNLYQRYLSHLQVYRFEILASIRQLGWIDALQNFEI